MIENLAAHIDVAKNNPQQAEKKYAAALNLFPDNRGLIYGYAEHFLAIKQPDNAIKLIRNKQDLYPEDAYFYDLLANAYSMKNKELLSHQALGEAYYRKYDLQHAVEQMDLAVKAKDGDFYQNSIVEARLKQLQSMLVDEKKAKL